MMGIYKFLYFCIFPMWFTVLVCTKLVQKRGLKSFWKRLFPDPILETDSSKSLIWIHAVSVGEVIAIAPVIRELREHGIRDRIVVSCVTETGLATVKKLSEDDVEAVLLPFDFSFSIRRCLKNVTISLLLFSEGDIWPVFVEQAKKKGAQVALINGKMSDKTFARLQRWPFVGKWLYSPYNYLCVQNDLMKERFVSIGVSQEVVYVTGNTKVDVPVEKMGDEEKRLLRKRLHVQLSDFIVILGSTHVPEEEEIIKQLEPLLQKNEAIKVIVVPRHPDRAREVHKQLESYALSLSFLSSCNEGWRILIVDSLGMLMSLYYISDVAVVCGSFEERIGGHNIYEPASVGIPVVVGPYMHSQKMLYESACQAQAITRASLTSLSEHIEGLFLDEVLRKERAHSAVRWAESLQGAAKKTAEIILNKKCSNSR